MKVQITGSEKDKFIELNKDIFEQPYNEPLVHQVVKSYLANSHRGQKQQKSRSMVSGGGAKPWKQKGTGRARAGTSRGPIWRSGGVTFAASPCYVEKKVPQKMYQGAMRSIFSRLFEEGRVKILADINIKENKTKFAAEWLKKLDLDKVLIIMEKSSEELVMAFRNLPNADLLMREKLNPVALVSSKQVVITVEAFQAIEEQLS